MAKLPFVDTHFHLHDMKHPTLRYGWLEPDATHPLLATTDPLKSQHYLIKDFRAETRFANVIKAIHVQAAVNTPDPVDESKWLQRFAETTGYPHGIIAECHLARPDAAEVLDRHLEYANVRGIRDFGEGRYLVDQEWRRGFAELRKRALVSCIDLRSEGAHDLADLARSFPDTTICVDHCAVPMERDAAYLADWRRALAKMAAPDNTIVKISGLGMRDPMWTVNTIRPLVLACIEAWGTERVVFGTNWPVDRMFSSYPDLLDAYAEIISDYPEADQRKMFSGNAERIFRI